MGVYILDGSEITSVYNISGTRLQEAYSTDGKIVFPTGLDQFSIFEPDNAPTGYIAGNSSGHRGDILEISTEQFLSTFYDGYISNPPDGITVTKTSIGKDNSGVYDIYQYDFCPEAYTKLILLSSGMHTYELSAIFGLANFINNIYTDGDDTFKFIRENIRIKVIPIVNPWGFNQNPKKYGNNLGVNPNRNFDYCSAWNSFPDYTPQQDEWNVKGSHPFSIAETVNLARWAENNWNAYFWIDCHTDQGNNQYDLDVYSLSDSVIANPINKAINKIKTWFIGKYNINPVVKHLLNNKGSIRQNWCEYSCGIPTFTLEQSPRRTTFGTDAQNSAADISNYCTNLSTFVQELLLQENARTIKPIASASLSGTYTIDVSNSAPKSRTIAGNVFPYNTTQNKFSWISSDDSVCAVYGGTEKIVVVGLANGTATLTGTNRYNSNIQISCNVIVQGY